MSYASDKGRWLREFEHGWERAMFKVTRAIQKAALRLAAKGRRPCDAVRELTPGVARRSNPRRPAYRFVGPHTVGKKCCACGRAIGGEGGGSMSSRSGERVFWCGQCDRSRGPTVERRLDRNPMDEQTTLNWIASNLHGKYGLPEDLLVEKYGREVVAKAKAQLAGQMSAVREMSLRLAKASLSRPRRNPLMMIMENPDNARPWYWECGKCGFVTPRSPRTQARTMGPCPRCRAEKWVPGTRAKSPGGGVPERRRNPYFEDHYRRVQYHTPEWERLVKDGWVTMTVDGGVATMIMQKGGRGYGSVRELRGLAPNPGRRRNPLG